jgi:hypothetical protein
VSKPPYADEANTKGASLDPLTDRNLEALLGTTNWHFLAYYFDGREAADQGLSKLVDRVRAQPPPYPLVVELMEVPKDQVWTSDYVILLSVERARLDEVTGTFLDHLNLSLGQQNLEDFNTRQGSQIRASHEFITGYFSRPR